MVRTRGARATGTMHIGRHKWQPLLPPIGSQVDPTLPRQRCPVCLRSVALKADGKMRAHNHCPGASGTRSITCQGDKQQQCQSCGEFSRKHRCGNVVWGPPL